jgi:hypothetical protein
MRLMFVVSVAFIVLTNLEWAANFLGFSIIGPWYTAGRMLEVAATPLIYVVAVLLREIREELRTNRT